MLEKYYDRDLSWFSFNERVLEEARDPRLPLFERIKFLAIYSSNLDEFYRVRVSHLQGMERLVDTGLKGVYNPHEVVSRIKDQSAKQQYFTSHILNEEILPALEENGIVLLMNDKLSLTEEQEEFIDHYFWSKIASFLQIKILKADNEYFLEDHKLYLILQLWSKTEGKELLAYLNIPSNKLPRFVKLPSSDGKFYTMFLDDVIRRKLPEVLKVYDVKGEYSVKLNRDADLLLQDEYSGNLAEKIKNHLKNRKTGDPSRFQFDPAMPYTVLKKCMEYFNLSEDEIIESSRYQNKEDFFGFPNPKGRELEIKKWKPVRHPVLEQHDSIFEALNKQEIMLHFPYHSYDHVLMFFNEAALSPDVTEIMATFYRVAEDSFIANALISAARNGKKVKAFVEAKARFDEANNLRWARKMEEAGVEITYSMPGIKVHAKTALIKAVINGEEKRFGFFGTGNFNEKTAGIYSDTGLLSSNEKMCKELEGVFNYLYERVTPEPFEKLMVCQFNAVDKIDALIHHEIKRAKQGKPASIFIKVNNLEDQHTIDQLYEASQVGVKVRLIVRSICRLRPGVKGLSENIKVKRIVDRYLEHSRVIWTHHDGENPIYLGSADLMKRNLYHRIEVMFPVEAKKLKKEVQDFVEFQWQDNVKSRLLNENIENISPEIVPASKEFQCQLKFYEYIKNKAKVMAEENLNN